MTKVTTPDHLEAAGAVNELMAVYNEVRVLVKIGEYKEGSDPRADRAIRKVEQIRSFLRQKTTELMPFDETIALLKKVAS